MYRDTGGVTVPLLHVLSSINEFRIQESIRYKCNHISLAITTVLQNTQPSI